ncbi:histidinol-phosphate transaminase [Candidatus Poriferisodalis sp.]|uniref:histidinol-phosphate transaminase n=1 Tax=Candidatus Poriferisodalis sp. TaxID=3101277 RepID=UPI003B02424A
MKPAVRDDLRLLDGYHSPQIDVEVRLNTNEAPVGPPPEFAEALAAELRSVDWHRYPDRTAAALRADLAALHGTGPDRIFVANGSNEVLQTLCLTYGGAGRSVATFEPTYAMYGQIARSTQCAVVESERHADGSVSVYELERVIERHQPSIVFLCSPNNPTGTPERLEVLERALEIASGLVVVDEAYGQFADWSAIDLCDAAGGPGNLVVTRTYSKTWAMAGARLGYAVVPAGMTAEFEKVVLPYHVDAFKQIAGRVALRFADQMEQRVAAIVSERQRIEHSLTRLGLDVWPSQSNFILFRTTPSGHGGDDVWQALVDRSVLVRNCSGWPRLADCLRVTVGTPPENDRFLEALSEVVSR